MSIRSNPCLPLILALFLANCGPKDDLVQTDSFASLSKSFKQPGHTFASAPLWVWNADVSKEMISSMLIEFKDNGFGGVFIHPRAGLITPYLSKEWFDLCAFTLQEAKKLDLDVWIYDENSYPSGFAGGHVPDVMPESYNQGQMLQLEKVKVLPDNPDDYFMALKKEDNNFLDVKKPWQAEKSKKGNYYLFKKTFYGRSDWYGGFSYVDLMVKGVTEKFIEQTMPGYEKIFGAEFGKSVPGVFSDEPNIEVQGEHAIRWTPDLFDVFQKKWGYPLETNLPSLFEETGDWKKVRHNYYQTLMQLFIDRWSKPYSDYMEKSKLEWTGHYWEHEWPNPNTVPDNMAMYAWHQRPAIDMLFNQFDEESPHAQFGNVRSVKELSSVANQLNKKRTLSETYGGAGWEITFKDLKRLGDWEFVLGVNTLNQHLSHMTIMGARKYDYPQSFSYHNPWFPYYKSLNDYFTRLTLMLSGGQQENKILIIEPTTTAWMYFNRDNPNPRFGEIGDQFQHFVTRLEKSQVEYDLGSENIIRDHGSVKDARFIIGSREYETVILPPGIENVDSATFELLEKFAAAGGTILQFSQLKTIDGKADKRLDDFYAKDYKGLKRVNALTDEIIRKVIPNNDFVITLSDSSKGNLYHHRRRLPDGEILFLANSTLDHPAQGTVRLQGADALVLDLFSGEIFHYPATVNDNHVQLEFTIPPAGSQLFFIPKEKQAGLKDYEKQEGEGTELPTTTEVRRLDDNTLTIDFCDIGFGKVKLKDFHTYDATDTLFKYYGFKNGNPWNTSVQFNNNTISRDTFSVGTGFTATYHFTISDKVDLSSIKAVVERAALYQVLVNDKPVKPVADTWWLDKAFNVIEVGPYLHIGQNKLSLVANKMSIHAEIEPIYLLGNFSLSPTSKGWTVAPPVAIKTGSWKDQGMPMYSQKVSYDKKLNLQKKTDKHYMIELGKWEGTVCAVTVNGQVTGIIAYPPYQLDITTSLKEGDNTIEVAVVGSLKNLLGPFHNKPKPGLVSPWHFRNVKKYPPGKEYDVYDYGLIEDYRVVEK